jgi:two-component system sensor histidine kinase HydH
MLGDALNAMAARLADYEREVAEQSRLVTLGNLAARVAHEVRNPLTAIKLQVQLLGESLDESGREKVARLLDEIGRLELVVSRTLAMGRPAQLEPAANDLNALVEEVTALMRPQFTHQGIRVDTRLDSVPVTVLDGDAIKQVLLNLLTNAADELGHGGSIVVRTAWDNADRQVVLRVEDSGAGVIAERQQGLFSPLASKKDTGFGLGLALCRELVALHGGTIEAGRSRELGGACFTVRLPIRNHDAADVSEQTAGA